MNEKVIGFDILSNRPNQLTYNTNVEYSFVGAVLTVHTGNLGRLNNKLEQSTM